MDSTVVGPYQFKAPSQQSYYDDFSLYMPGDLYWPPLSSASSASTPASPFPSPGVAHEQWVDTTYGVGQPFAAAADAFHYDYLSCGGSLEGLCQGKLPDCFVGECR